MVDLVLSPSLRQARSRFEYVDSSGYSASRYNGVGQTTSYGGDRVRATIDFTPCGGATSDEQNRRAQLKSMMTSLRGSQGRIWLTDVSSPLRGTFPATELFTNSDFSNGATGWTADAEYTARVVNGVYRATRNAVTAKAYPAYQAPTHVQYGAYATRILSRAGRGAFAAPYAYTFGSNGSVITNGSGYAISTTVVTATSGQSSGIYDDSASGLVAGDYIDILLASCSRCLLIDAMPNLLQRSDEVDLSPWNRVRSSVSGSATAPDATATGDVLTEDSSNNTHYVTQSVAGLSSAATDYCFSIAVRAGARSFVALTLDEATAGTSATQYFNLTTGAVGASGSTGANWANRRAFVTSLGNAWYLCTLIARKTNAATQIGVTVSIASADGTGSYLGNGTSGISLWRATLSPSSVPSALRSTTSAAAAATPQQGSLLNVKGGRAPGEGALLSAIAEGDWVETDGQILMATAPLDLNAAGIGGLAVSPAPRRDLADNTPIIVHKPMGRFMIPRGSMAGWSNEPGVFSSAQLELEAAFA